MDQIMPGTHALGAIPPRVLEDMVRAGLIVEEDGRTRLGDEFRIAASRLQSTIKASIAAGERGGNLLLVTSTRPAEGKSFCAVNMAAALSQTASRQVLLVDADLKPGCLSELVGIRDYPGLLDLTADSALDPTRMITATPLPGLFLLPIGHADEMSEGIRAQPLASAAEKLARSFPDMTVVLDTGPLLSTSDPGVISPVVSQVLMVVEAGRTQRNELEAALDLIQGGPRVLLMMNKLAGRHRSSFGAYSYSGDYYVKPNAPPPSSGSKV